jgi:hypothetical protein
LDIIKEWERDPPTKPMTSMSALWHDFMKRRRDLESPVCKYRDNIPDECAKQKRGKDALRIAVRSIRPNGKMHGHQSKVSLNLPMYEEQLIAFYDYLKKAKNFGELHGMMDNLATHGIGPVTTYDVAVRFGSWLGLHPEGIYVHAGTTVGLDALGIESRNRRVIPMEDLPRFLRNKPPDEVEDFLCTYRDAFDRISV